MTEVEKSFERHSVGVPLHMVAESWGGGYDLRDTELCVFGFGDGQFVLRPDNQDKLGGKCTAIHMGDRKYSCWKTSKQSTTFYLECTNGTY